MVQDIESNQTKMALMQKDIENIKKSQDRMELSLAALQGVFWTTRGHEEFALEVNRRLTSIEGKATVRQYQMPILASVVTAIVTFLIIQYLQHFK